MDPIASQDDEHLLEQARKAGDGDMRAFEQLVRRHQERIVANCRYLTRSPADSEDLAQEVFLKAYFNLSRFEGRSSFRTWIQRIKINHCLNHLKKHSRYAFVEVDGLQGAEPEPLRVDPPAAKVVEASEDRERIATVLQSMSDTLRVPLILRDLDHHSYDEIAALLGIGLSAVKMRIKRARAEFRLRYTEANPAESFGATEHP